MNRLQQLQQRIIANIPLTGHLGFQLLDWNGQYLQLTAPLALNSNDKGTFFAGSQSALLTLAGWACTTLAAEDAIATADVVAVRTRLDYQAPVTCDATIRAWAETENLATFANRLKRRARAPLTVTAALYGGDIQGSVFEADYLARQL